MGAQGSFKTLVLFNLTIQNHIPEDKITVQITQKLSTEEKYGGKDINIF